MKFILPQEEEEPPIQIYLSRHSDCRVDVCIGNVHAIQIFTDGKIGLNLNCEEKLQSMGFSTDDDGGLHIIGRIEK